MKQILGLKIFTTNNTSFKKLREFYENKIIDYVELYIVPGEYDKASLSVLKGIPIIFHAPNLRHEFNLRDKNKVFHESLKTIKKVSAFFGEKRIIFHPGIEKDKGDITEIINNIRKIRKDFDLILENVPKEPSISNKKLIAAKYEEFKHVIEETGTKFCLDIGHAIYSANYYHEDPIEYIKKYVQLGPYMFHLSDGNFVGLKDIHKSFFEGNFPIKEIIKILPKNARITLETPKSNFINLHEDILNIKKLRKLISQT